MNQSEFYDILEGNYPLKTVVTEEIQELIEKYPYASNLFAIQAMALHEQENPGFELALEKAAARIGSRKKLYHLIMGKPSLELVWTQVPDDGEALEESENLIEEETAEINSDQPESAIEIEPEFDSNVDIDPDPEDSQIKEPESQIQEISSEEVKIQGVEEDAESKLEEINSNSAGQKKPRKNEFSFSFVKVNSKKSQAKNNPVSTFQVYDIHSTEPKSKSKTKRKEEAIIEKFLEASPSISPPTIDFGEGKSTYDLAENSGKLIEEIVTENMAMIYLKQKNFQKALQIYRKLKLKYPEKGDYFAALIKNLENTIV